MSKIPIPAASFLTNRDSLTKSCAAPGCDESQCVKCGIFELPTYVAETPLDVANHPNAAKIDVVDAADK